MVPFFGSVADGREMLGALSVLRLGPQDEIVVADDTPEGVLEAVSLPDRVRVVHAPLQQSSYYARNVGAESSSRPWLLFLDSDCRPAPDLIDRYWSPPPAGGSGIVSGVVRAAEQRELIARYAASRGHINPRAYDRPGHRPAGVTANLLVRRDAWEAVGGFHEGIRSGGDVEFCLRVQDAGFAFEWRTGAVVEHAHVTTLRALLRKTRRHAAGRAFVDARYPGHSAPQPVLPGVARAVVGTVVWAVLLRPRRALFKAIDGLFLVVHGLGRLGSNRAPGGPVARTGQLVVASTWPASGADPGPGSLVLALRRGDLPRRERDPAVRVLYAEDEGIRGRAAALGLAIRRPAVAWSALRARTSVVGAAQLAVQARRHGGEVRAATAADTHLAGRVSRLARRR